MSLPPGNSASASGSRLDYSRRDSKRGSTCSAVGFLDHGLPRRTVEEPSAPTLSLGERVIWIRDTGPQFGTIRWIGRMPYMTPDWTVGVEFDNPIGAGNGKFGGRRYFSTKENHAYFLPLLGLVKAEEYEDSICKGVGPCLHPINIPWMSKPTKMTVSKPQNIGCCFSGHGNPCEGSLNQSQHCCCNVCNHTCDQCTLQCSRIAMDTVEGTKGSPFLHRAEKVGCINEVSKYHPVKPCLVNGMPRTIQRRKSVTIKETSCDTQDCQRWLEGGATLHRKWKSSDQYIVSCPQTTTAPFEVYIAKEVSSDTSDSDAEQRGGLRSLVSCLMPGQQHRRKKQAKTSPGKGKKKLLFVPASGFIRQGIRSGSEGSIPSSSSISASSMSIQSFSGFSGNKSPDMARHSVYSCSGLDLIAPQSGVRRISDDSTASCSHVSRDLSAIGRSGSFGTLTKKKKPPPPPPPRSARFRHMEGSKTLGRLSSISSGSSVSESVKSEAGSAPLPLTPPTRSRRKYPDGIPSGTSSPLSAKEVQVHSDACSKPDTGTRAESQNPMSSTSSGSSSDPKKSHSSTLHLLPAQDKVVTGKPPIVSPKKPSHKKPAPQPPSNAPSPARSNQSAEGASPKKPSSLYQGTTQTSLVSLTTSSLNSSPRSPASVSHNQLPSSSTSSSSVTHTRSTGSQGTLPSSSLKTEPEENIPGLVLITSQREQAIRFNSLSRSLRRVFSSDDKLSKKSKLYENVNCDEKETLPRNKKMSSVSLMELDKLRQQGKPELPKKTKPHDTETLFGFSLPRRKLSKKATSLSRSEEVLSSVQNGASEVETRVPSKEVTHLSARKDDVAAKGNMESEIDDASVKETITTSMEVKIGTMYDSSSSRSSSRSSQFSQASQACRKNLTLPIEKKESGVQVGSSSIPTLKRKVTNTESISSSSSRSPDLGKGSKLDNADPLTFASASQDSGSSCVVLPESSPLSPHNFSDSSSSPTNQESKTSASSTPGEASDKSKFSSSSSSSSRADVTSGMSGSALSVKDFIGSIKQLAEKPTQAVKENSLRNDRISLYMERLPHNYAPTGKKDARERAKPIRSFPTKWQFSQGDPSFSCSTSESEGVETAPPTCHDAKRSPLMSKRNVSGLPLKHSMSLDSFAVEDGSESSTLSRSSSTISVSSVSSCSSCRTEIPVVQPSPHSYATLKRKTRTPGCRSCSPLAGPSVTVPSVSSSSPRLLSTDSPSAKILSSQCAINSTQGLPAFQGTSSSSLHNMNAVGSSSSASHWKETAGTHSMAHSPQSGLFPVASVPHSLHQTYMTEQAQSAALLQQLELAISRGHHTRASALARELAMRKVACTLSHARKNSRGQPSSGIMVNLYVEDKNLHQGPIPLHIFPSMTLRMLKTKMAREFDFAMDLQRWILGKMLATDDDATLSSYGITSPGCPVYLYLMSPNEVMNGVDFPKEAEDSSLSNHSDHSSAVTPNGATPVSQSAPSPQLSVSDGSWTCNACGFTSTLQHTLCPVCAAPDDDIPLIDEEESGEERNLSSPGGEADSLSQESDAVKDYQRLVELDDVDLVANAEDFDCPICFITIHKGEGVTLRDCLHMFCRECIKNAVQYSEAAEIKCPFRNEEYACDSQLQDREIKAVVPPELYEKYLQRSVSTAESSAEKSFHCKSPDCPGWCVYEDNVNEFPCPVCSHVNCLTCQAIHEGKNCRQYQDELDSQASNSEEARKTKEYLDNMLKVGEAMRCPQCQVIVMKKWGCDWLKCSMCKTEICWVTKGPRWGPGGRGDTSSGCKCGVKGVRCHPKCNYCH